MNNWISNNTSRVLNKVNQVREWNRDRRSEARQEKYRRIIEDKKTAVNKVDSRHSIRSAKSETSTSGEDLENKTLVLKLREFGDKKGLPDWVQQQLEQRMIYEKEYRRYMTELDVQKDKILTAHQTSHWVVTGQSKAVPRVREDDLINTPYPFTRQEIHVPGKSRQKAQLAIKRIKTDDPIDESVSTDSKTTSTTTTTAKDTHSSRESKPKSNNTASTEKKHGDQIAPTPSKSNVQQAVSQIRGAIKDTKKKLTETGQKEKDKGKGKDTASEKKDAVKEKEKKSTNKTSTDGNIDLHDLQDTGGLDQLVNALFDTIDPQDSGKGSVADDLEREAEQNAVINLAITMPGPDDKPGKEGLVGKKTQTDERRKSPPEKPTKIVLRFEEAVKYKDYWYTAGKQESDVYSKKLKPCVTG